MTSVLTDIVVVLFAVFFRLAFASPLDFLHLGALVLEPNLDHSNAQSGLFRERLANLTEWGK